MTDDLIKTIEVLAIHEKTVTQILTLAVEYEAKTITAERFSDRVMEIIRLGYTKYIPQKT